MNQPETKRSGMLSTIYNMLPGIDNDYAAKLVYTLEDKKTIPQLQQDIADLAAQLSSDSAMTDTTIAKMLLDECTLAAALRQLRIYNNSTSINELCAALNMPATQTGTLLEVYASFSSRQYFDEAFEATFDAFSTDGIIISYVANKFNNDSSTIFYVENIETVKTYYYLVFAELLNEEEPFAYVLNDLVIPDEILENTIGGVHYKAKKGDVVEHNGKEYCLYIVEYQE